MFPVFVRCVLVIALAELILFGFFFSAALLADFIHLRTDVICVLLVVGCLVIATVMELMKVSKGGEGREAITEIRTVEKRPDPRDWTGEAE